MEVELHRSTAPGGRRRRPTARALRSLASCLLTAAALGALATAGCGGERGARGERASAPAPAATPATPADAEWTWLQEAKRRLDSRRAHLARLEAAAGATPVPPSTAPPPAEAPSTAAPTTQAPSMAAPPADAPAGRLRREVDLLASEFARRLVDYINAHPPVQGEALGGRQLAALRMKSDEEMVQARAYIERGGDYQRAIEIYEAALAVDPGNERLERELARARQMRYMTPERFAQVKEGMTPAEVRKLLGQPNLHNVREYADRGVVAWFYPKDPTGAAAAVWFHREKGEADLTVYMADFEAVRTGAPEQQQAG